MKDMHRVLKKILGQRRFFCQMAGCEFHNSSPNEKTHHPTDPGLPYSEALDHLKTCRFKAHPCPQGCGTKFMPDDLEKHLPLCPEYEERCHKCDEVFKPNKGKAKDENHDCFENLKQKNEAIRKEERLLDLDLGTNYDRLGGLRCPKGQQMYVHTGVHIRCLQRGQSISMSCSKCNRKDLNKFDAYYACKLKDCACKNYFICRLCAL